MANHLSFSVRLITNHSNSILVLIIGWLFHALQILANQWLPNYLTNMISSNILSLCSFFSQHQPLDTHWSRSHYFGQISSSKLKFFKIVSLWSKRQKFRKNGRGQKTALKSCESYPLRQFNATFLKLVLFLRLKNIPDFIALPESNTHFLQFFTLFFIAGFWSKVSQFGKKRTLKLKRALYWGPNGVRYREVLQ